MTDASMTVATIENRPMPAPLDRPKEAVQTKGRSFAETLEKAEARQPESSSASQDDKASNSTEKLFKVKDSAGKKDASPKTSDRLTTATLKKNVKGKTLKGLSDQVPGGKRTRNLSKDGESAKKEVLLMKNNTPSKLKPGIAGKLSEGGSEAVPAVKKASDKMLPDSAESAGQIDISEDAGVHTFPVPLENRKNDIIHKSGKVRKTASTRVSPSNIGRKKGVEEKVVSANMTGKSGRVEVLDKRGFLQSKTDKVRSANHKNVLKEGSREPRQGEPSNNSTPVRTEGFAVAESEIELGPASLKDGSVRNAAAELARRLDGEAGADIVRQVKVVLNKSEAGEVQINLRPDNLGRVRVRIQLDENRLTGRIFVESAAAREAFRDAVGGLQAKLVEAGFSAADLELAWDESAGSFAENQNNRKNNSTNSGHSAREFENTVPTTVIDEIADGGVNLVV